MTEARFRLAVLALAAAAAIAAPMGGPAAAEDAGAMGRALAAAGAKDWAAADAAAVRTLLSVLSTAETNTAITNAVAAVVNGAGADYDTLVEIQALLEDNDGAIATITSALANRVRTDTAAQGLDSTQRANARTNIDVYSKAEIGDVAADFVATFLDARA